MSLPRSDEGFNKPGETPGTRKRRYDEASRSNLEQDSTRVTPESSHNLFSQQAQSYERSNQVHRSGIEHRAKPIKTEDTKNGYSYGDRLSSRVSHQSASSRGLEVNRAASRATTDRDGHTDRVQQKLIREKERSSKLEQELRQEDQSGADAELQHQRERERLLTKMNHLRYELRSKQTELEKQKEKVKLLKLQAFEDREKPNQVNSRAVSMMAEDVSRDMPDDTVANLLNTFFQGDFLSWCAEMCVDKIDVDQASALPLNFRGLNRSDAYEALPPHLKFDFTLPDGRSSFVLLQAALSEKLVEVFLDSPYFLEPTEIAFPEVEQYLYDEAIEWRTKLVKILETVAPFLLADATRLAREFEQEARVLLKDPDEESRRDLADLFAKFSDIAIKLWKSPTEIRSRTMVGFQNCPYRKSDPWTECETTTLAQLGDQVNGRPIGVVMRPLITSQAIQKPGEDYDPYSCAVWSKALVWVSSKPDPHD
ncbi:hypothetical protein CCM_01401 [Cordyceps militaris CM01]|uniref:Uncharacterized protein n=1 Tax=Cordyceps militaris (strain CM01) TaxID=983644 RepID=G3J4S8_CORMM|nr:uncharacterized protein CCM_01401 [Cordyceps militaris CM01]EGX96743.1 hypothetical protein CCM_01401 [Cordyceps militaris CM01]